MQSDLFTLPSLAPSSPSPSAVPAAASAIAGLEVRLPSPCRCGNHFAIIGSSSGPHAARLDCTACGTWCRWLSHQEAAFITEIVGKFGCPTTPIAIRQREGV